LEAQSLHAQLQSCPRPKPQANEQDFVKKNSKAAAAGCANATQLKEFSSKTDIKRVPPAANGAVPKVIPSDVIPSFAYGRKSRPSTPINAVVNGLYGVEFEEMHNVKYADYEKQREKESKTVVRLTKASKSRIQAAHRVEPEGQKEVFKLSKFKNVPGRLSKTSLGKSHSMGALPAQERDSGLP